MSDTPFHELSNLRKYAEHLRWIVDAYSIPEKVKEKLLLTAEVLDAEAEGYEALLAVKEAAGELSLAMRVIEDWKTDAITRRVKRLADALAALPEHLK